MANNKKKNIPSGKNKPQDLLGNSQSLPQTPKQQMRKPKKSIEDFDQSKPLQLELFESLLPNDKQFSNTIEFYDFCPKYVYWRNERVQDKFLDRIEREFQCRGVEYSLSVDPAKVKDSDGVVRDYFPGLVEELVEDGEFEIGGPHLPGIYVDAIFVHREQKPIERLTNSENPFTFSFKK